MGHHSKSGIAAMPPICLPVPSHSMSAFGQEQPGQTSAAGWLCTEMFRAWKEASGEKLSLR